MENLHLCMGCMRPISENAVICPHCAYNAQSRQNSPFLEKGTTLKDRYITGKVLSSSSDHAAYIGYDFFENKTVKVIEFLPEKLIERQSGSVEITVKNRFSELYETCLSSFESLWKTVGEIQNPLAVDEVYEVFALNNTAYAITQYTEGITLRDFFDERQKPFSWTEAYRAFLPIMSAVSKFHRMGAVHAEISPATIYVTADGRFRISGFSIPQSHGTIPELNSFPVGGYASIERYKDPSIISASSDVYSLACVFYTAVSGLVAPNAQNRITNAFLSLPGEVEKRISPEAVEAFRNAVQVFPSSRTGTVEEIIKSFLCEEKEPAKTPQPNETYNPGFANETEEKPAVSSADKTEESTQNTEPQEASVAAVIVKSFFSVLIIAVLIFSTLYTTVLYKSMHIEFYEKVFGSFSFLPMNIDREQSAVPQVIPQETTLPEKVSVADFTALSYEYIKQNAIFAQNYDLVYEFEYSEKFKKNEIIMQSIPAGEDVDIGTTIIIYVSRGNKSVVLRDVIGMKYDDAYKILTDDGFVVSKRNLKNDGAQTSGEVYTMSLVAGLEFEIGTQIILSVWE